jgi:hypothetical protein
MFDIKQQALIWGLVASFAVMGAQAHDVKVKGTANPYLAGQPAGTMCCRGDSVPAESPAPALNNLQAGETLSFSTTGSVGNQRHLVAPSADGYTNMPLNMTADYGTGVSGPLNVYMSGLLGVFTNGTQPVDPAPPQLNSGVNFKTLSPGLNQIFWIGDGLTGTGTGRKQKFIVPAGATTLFLGVADSYGWANNPGKIIVKIHAKPAQSILRESGR